MARMHSRNKGHAGSTRPAEPYMQQWIRYKPQEVEMIIAKLAKEGKSQSEIGIILRDSYGIPSIRQLTGKKIGKILEEKELQGDIPDDLRFLMKRAVGLRKHLAENKQDMAAKRGLQLTESKIHRLVRYYKQKGKLSTDWKYDSRSVQMYI